MGSCSLNWEKNPQAYYKSDICKKGNDKLISKSSFLNFFFFWKSKQTRKNRQNSHVYHFPYFEKKNISSPKSFFLWCWILL